MKLIRTHRLLFPILLTVLMTACATGPQRRVVWTDPSVASAPRPLLGKRVLVDCGTADPGLRLSCQLALAREIQAAGVEPVTRGEPLRLGPDGSPGQQLAPSAVDLGAAAVFTVALTPGTVDAGGSGFSLGLGGFSVGRGGGIGVGAAVPIGTSAPSVGLVAVGEITDAATRRLLWSATFANAPSSDFDRQAEALTQALTAAAKASGLF